MLGWNVRSRFDHMWAPQKKFHSLSAFVMSFFKLLHVSLWRTLLIAGSSQSRVDPSLFFHKSSQGISILLVYVNDIYLMKWRRLHFTITTISPGFISHIGFGSSNLLHRLKFTNSRVAHSLINTSIPVISLFKLTYKIQHQ